MALWAGLTINNTRAANLFNGLYQMKGLDVVRKQNALLYAILGKKWMETNGAGGIKTQFERRKTTALDKVEVKFLGALDTINTVADATSSSDGGFASATPTWAANYWGSMQVALAHYYDVSGIPTEEWDNIRGNNAKTENFIAERMNQILLSLENTIGTAIHATASTALGRTLLGGWRMGASDGVTSGESNFATYCTIDRTDSANADLRGVVTGSTLGLSLKKLRAHQNAIAAKYSMPDIGIGDVTTITEVQSIIDAVTTTIENDGDWREFNGMYCQLGNVRYLGDQRSAANVLGHLNSSTWVFYEKETGMSTDGFIKAPHLKSAYVLPWDYWCQLICVRPSANGVLTGITF